MSFHLRPFAVFLAAALLLAPVLACAQPTPEEVRVPMQDGTKLVTDVYLPPGDGPWPVLMLRSPYPKEASRGMVKGELDRGYAVVVQNARGIGDSEGVFDAFASDGWGANQDGVDVVNWIRAQSWCDGNVGGFGMSAPAYAQVMLAGAGADVDAQIIEMSPLSWYHDAIYMGGVWRKEQADTWLSMFQDPGLRLIDEYKAHPLYGPYWEPFNAATRIEQSTAPALWVAGWFDIFKDGTIEAFRLRQEEGAPGARGNQKLIIKPSAHGPYPDDIAIEFPDNFDELRVSHHRQRFMAHWLQDDDTGYMNEPAVHYYTIGDVSDPDAPGMEWRTADAWPPFDTTPTRLYLAGDGLADEPPDAAGIRAYAYDPADPCPTTGGMNLTIPSGPFDQKPLADRGDVLVYLAEPLDAPLEATGMVRLELHVSTDVPDTDFVGKLVDVYPDGRHVLVTERIQRLKLREGFDRALPPLAEGEVAKVAFDLGQVSWVFNTGHRIGLYVTSSNHPHSAVNPNTGADHPEGEDFRVAHNVVHAGRDHPSALVLPVR